MVGWRESSYLNKGWGPGIIGASSFTTLDPVNNSVPADLSNGNLTVTCGASAFNGRSLILSTSGKPNHFEVTLTAGTNMRLGCVDAAYPITSTTDFLGEVSGNSLAVDPNGTFVNTSNGSVPGFATFTTGDTVAFERDANGFTAYAVNGGAWQVAGFADKYGAVQVYAAVYAGASGVILNVNFGQSAPSKAVGSQYAGAVWWGK